MPAAHPTTNSPNTCYWIEALVIVLLALVAGCGLFFTGETVPNLATPAPLAEQGWLDGDANNDGGIDGINTPLVVARASARPLTGTLDTDLDNDGNDGDIADPLAVLVSVPLLIPLLGSFLLSVFELAKLSWAYWPPLERPG